MKKETWRTVTFVDPATGSLTTITSRKGGCPNCGQSRCTKRSVTCIAVQDAIKKGSYSDFKC